MLNLQQFGSTCILRDHADLPVQRLSFNYAELLIRQQKATCHTNGKMTNT